MSTSRVEITRGVFDSSLLTAYELGTGHQAQFITEEQLSLAAIKGQIVDSLLKSVETKIPHQPVSVTYSDIQEVVQKGEVANPDQVRRYLWARRSQNIGPQITEEVIRNQQDIYVERLGVYATMRSNLWVGQLLEPGTRRNGKCIDIVKFAGITKLESDDIERIKIRPVVKDSNGELHIYDQNGELFMAIDRNIKLDGIKNAKVIRPDLFGGSNDDSEYDVRPPIA